MALLGNTHGAALAGCGLGFGGITEFAMMGLMSQAGAEQQQALMRRARESLDNGVSPDAVFADLAVDARDLRAVAIAVCMAAGTPRADAEGRWDYDIEQLRAELHDGDEAAFGDILEMTGFFDFHRPLDEREQHVRAELRQAMATALPLPSGYAHLLGRMLQTGRLTSAFIKMTTLPLTDATAYWAHLLAAADLLTGSEDDQFESCVNLCRQRLDQAGTLPPD
jgi:hypothetical protein